VRHGGCPRARGEVRVRHLCSSTTGGPFPVWVGSFGSTCAAHAHTRARASTHACAPTVHTPTHISTAASSRNRGRSQQTQAPQSAASLIVAHAWRAVWIRACRKWFVQIKKYASTQAWIWSTPIVARHNRVNPRVNPLTKAICFLCVRHGKAHGFPPTHRAVVCIGVLW